MADTPTFPKIRIAGRFEVTLVARKDREESLWHFLDRQQRQGASLEIIHETTATGQHGSTATVRNENSGTRHQVEFDGQDFSCDCAAGKRRQALGGGPRCYHAHTAGVEFALREREDREYTRRIKAEGLRRFLERGRRLPSGDTEAKSDRQIAESGHIVGSAHVSSA